MSTTRQTRRLQRGLAAVELRYLRDARRRQAKPRLAAPRRALPKGVGFPLAPRKALEEVT